ncbi:MAG TPA: DUF6259 domain-containing protein [Verrucomicrobiae bacterium]|nr:DUF6259 domain-containing protein [Verrucomicrobiae bacterium]
MRLFGIILCGACVTAMAAGAADVAVLENTSLRMEIRGAPTPSIERLIHKPSGQEIVVGSKGVGLFSIFLEKPGGATETIESGRAGESSIAAPGSGGVTIRCGKFPVPGLVVEVTATCETNSLETLWSMRIENGTGRRITAVRFPQALAVETIGEGIDDFIVLPAMSGSLIENPSQNWREGQSVNLRYPGDLSAQFLAYQDRTAGLYLAGMDSQGHPKSMVALKQAGGTRFWHEVVPVPDAPGADGKDWRSSYPVALGVTSGTWCDTADRYKRWALNQAWCAKRLVDRGDIPTWWKNGPDVHVCEVRTYDSKRTCTGSYYPRLLDHLRTFREKIDGPIVAMLAGWENHRRWTGGDYFPIFDADNARRVIGEMKQEGFRPFFFLSGLFYTYRNEGRDGGEISAANGHAASYVVDEKTGNPKEYVLNESNPSGDWKRHSYQFCASAPETRKFFCDVIDRARDVGVDVLQMDQTTQGAADACYSAAHGHPPGPGVYQSRSFWALLDALRQHGKKGSADFILLHEEPHEQLIPHLDGFHVREYFEKRWYRGYPGAVGIPLFSYLYHEYAIGYGGDSAGLSKDNSRWNVRCHAMNLVAGRTPGGSIWSSHQSMYDAHPDQIAIIRNHCRLLKTRAKDFLMLGTMLHPLELRVPMLDIGLGVRKGDKWVTEKIPTPAILTSSWQSPDGAVGHLFVSIAETKQPLKVALDTRNAPPARSYDAEILRSTDVELFKPLWRKAQMPKEFIADLEPMETVFIELRKSGGG